MMKQTGVPCGSQGAAAPAARSVDLLSKRHKLLLLAVGAILMNAWVQIHCWFLRRTWELFLSGGWTAALMALVYFTICLGTFESMGGILLLFRAKRVDGSPLPPHFRVAMIATKVPSEPLSMLRETLGACLAQDYPYPFDVWLADEDPDPATKAWCAENGVRISCRKGIAAYHQPTWPRRTRCKEGNLAYFYDTWGYDAYDVVAQFDADHVPALNYLSTALPAFLDDSVGYVALPSICGANEPDHGWAVRMRLFAEGVMHGSQGAGMSDGWMPCCIGSHYVVRTKALKAVGGIGPELDEDFSTSVMLSAGGHKGVFSLDTIAHGDGPVSFEDGMYQEYQWARSGVLLYLQYFPPLFRQAGWRVRLRLVNAFLSWLVAYPLTALFPVLLAVVALSRRTAGTAGYMVPLLASPCQPGWLYMAQVAAGGLMLGSFINANGWMRPVDCPVISWEAMLHLLSRPYFATKGIAHGLWSHFTGQPLNIRVTPKGPQGEKLMPPSCIMPFVVVAVLLSLAGLANRSMVLLVAIPAVAHCGAGCLLVALHYRDHHSGRRFPTHNFIALAAPLATALAFTLAMLRARGGDILAIISDLLSCGVASTLAAEHPVALAYTAAVVTAGALSLCFARRAFFTPLRTHRRGPPA